MNLSEPPQEITFILYDGTGDRSVISGEIRLDNASVGNVTGPGMQNAQLEPNKLSNGTHAISVRLVTESRTFQFDWSFILKYPTPPPVNNTNGTNNTNNTNTNNTGNNTNGTQKPFLEGPMLMGVVVGVVLMVVVVAAALVVIRRRKAKGERDS